ncbi:MAG: endonuclease/exonuclease/phosphatase family protein [Arenimonas sp.]
MTPVERRGGLRLRLLDVPLLLSACQHAASRPEAKGGLRVATYNTSLYSDEDGGLLARLNAGDDNARKIAAVIQHQRPDLLLLNEFDYDEGHLAADAFQHRYLEVAQFGQAPIQYPYRYLAPVNTGMPSGMDLDHDGKIGGGNDSFGFGNHPGQYGMLVLSRYPIDDASIRSFQEFAWKDLPGALAPMDPNTGEPWYPWEVWTQLRLSSKSHWDVPVQTPAGTIHFLVDHPTPPVFDGPEDRNGRRNHDEIRLWAEYISGGDKAWLCDDGGRCGGLPADALFVIAGDHNADPVDGDSSLDAMAQLLGNPRLLRYPAPTSKGAVRAAKAAGGGNLSQKGPAAQDTGDFGPKVGNLRLDYVLPSTGLQVRASGVFWPKPGAEGADWIDASDHHMVWLDLGAP